jgi:methionyl-tRNA formyltransferase
MRIIFTGSGEFGLPTLKALVGRGHEIATVYTQPDRPAGRGRKMLATAIGQFAVEQSLPLVRTANLSGEKLPDADVMVVIAFGQKIAPAAVNHPNFGSINLHASLVPKYRGAAPINWAILRGETVTGNSVIRLAPKMDAGAILGQSEIAIGEAETAGELHDRLAIDGAALVLKVLETLARGEANEIPQDESKATDAPKLGREMSGIDWNSAADEIARKIRGMSPWPGCRVRLLDGGGVEKARLTLVRAVAAEGEGPRWHAGEIGMHGDISCGDGWTAVKILEVQQEGKRPMPLEDFRRGHSWMAGMRLESITSS